MNPTEDRLLTPALSSVEEEREKLRNLIPTINQLNWPLLLKQTKRFARRQMRRYFWRGEEKGGLLPDGYEPSSIAAEAVAEFLTSHSQPSTLNQEPIQQLSNLNQEQVRRALRRRAHHLIDRLRHRKENLLFRNVEDLAPVTTDDDETIAVWELIPAPDPTPLEALIHKEECAELQKLKAEFIAFLGEDNLLQDVFRCLCEGISKRATIARKLSIGCNTVKNAQKRLDRQIAEFNRRRKVKKV